MSGETSQSSIVNSQLPDGYKQTDVGIIPEDWDVKSMKDVCVLINGRGFKPYEWKKHGLPIIRIQNLNGSDEFNYFDGQFNPKLIVEKGQLLFAWSGSRGTSFGPHIWDGTTALLNYHTWKLVLDEKKLYKKYFLHYLRILTREIEEKAHGASALVHTQKGEMECFVIPIPPLPEQQAIAEVLSDVDALITSLDQLITKKRNIKQGAMQLLLTGKKRLVGFSGDWKMKTLGEIAPLQRGFDLPNKELKQGTYPVVYSNGILNRHNTYKAKAPGVVTGRSGTIGKVIFVSEDYFPHNTSLWVTDFKDNSPKFIYYLYVFLKLERFGTGSGVPTLNRNDVHSFGTSIPPTKEEQQAIAQTLSDMDAEIEALEKKREKYKAIKQGMMQELLTGKTRLVGKS